MKLRSVAMLVAILVSLTRSSPALAMVTLPPPSMPLPTSGSFLYLNSEPGDWIGQGREQLFTNANSTIGGALRGSTFSATAYLPNTTWTVGIASAEGQPLVVGTYTNAARLAFRPLGSNGLDVSGDGRGCNTVTGSFDVNELAFSALGEITVFDATFEQHCEGLAPALFGRIRIESPAPAPNSTLPPGSITVPTSGSFLYLIRTNTSVGAYEQLYTSADSTLSWSIPWVGNNEFRASVVQGNYVHFWNVDLGAPLGQSLAVGHYPDAVRTMSRTGQHPGIDVSGDGSGCNELSGYFDVDEFTFAWNGELSTFQATFHFYCDNSLFMQHGRIRIENPTPPAPPMPVLGITIDDKGKATDASGYAWISGTVSCSPSNPWLMIRGTVTQTKPDHIVVLGSFSSGIWECTAPTTRWLLPAGGTDRFGASTAQVSASVEYCDTRGCVRAETAKTVRLNQGGK